MNKMKIQEERINTIEELEQLMKAQKLFHPPLNIQVILNLSWLNGNQKKLYEQRFSNYVSDCGCMLGAFCARILTLICLIGLCVFIILNNDLPILLDLALVIALPVLFVIGNFIFPLVSLLIFSALTLYIYSPAYIQGLLIIAILIMYYFIGAALGKSYGVFKSRKKFYDLLADLKGKVILED